MLNFKKYWNFIVLILLGLFSACQSESVVETYNTNETMTNTTPLTTYIERVAMQTTSVDNSIDKTSCFAIKFPYVITVNNKEISLNSSDDYIVFQNNIDAYSTDNDIVFFHYPITVTLNDYSEKTLTNQTTFNNLILECQSKSNDFGKINCVTINFPISISSYDGNKKNASTRSFTNNQNLYSFIKNLEDNKYIAIKYPIYITNSNGQNSSITSNNQFEDLLKNAINTCPDNTNTSIDFIQTLTNNNWKISYYFYETVKTSNYSGYVFTFNSNNKVIATKTGISYNGTWSTKVDNGVREFEIKMESEPLRKLDEGWKLFEFNSTQLRFRHEEGAKENHYLNFEKI